MDSSTHIEQPVHDGAALDAIYKERFKDQESYRKQVWSILTRYFSQWIPTDSAVLDLGCGYCEFINQVQSPARFGMDLNPEAKNRAAASVKILEQDCSVDWSLAPGSLTTVFTSNFLEHLPTKTHVEKTLMQAHAALCDGGRLIAMGPNIRLVPGAYWDFFDHYVALTERSLEEVLTKCGFKVEVCRAAFLPYSMSQGRTYPLWMLRLYLKMPILWRLFGKQFLVVASKSGARA